MTCRARILNPAAPIGPDKAVDVICRELQQMKENAQYDFNKPVKHLKCLLGLSRRAG